MAFDLPVPVAGEWSFDPDWITLNNGSYGACPATVRDAEAGWRARFERQPTAFIHRDLAFLLRDTASVLAERVGAAPDDIALVSNATEAINAVLRSRRLAPGDEILLLDQAYGAVRNAVVHVAELAGARVVEVALPADPAPEAVVDAVARAITDRCVLAVLDHVTSPGALVLPIAAMVAACRARGVKVLVDGAHVPGQLPLDLGAIGADWYAANLHKWMFAPVGTGFLHAAPSAQDGLHPLAISHGLGRGFVAEFDWTGTRDFAGWLALSAALAFHARLGGEALMRRNAALAQAGAALVAAALDTECGPACLPGGAMALVAIPGAVAEGGATPADAAAVRARLIARRIDIPVSCVGGRLWLRLSAQAYNDLADFERAAVALRFLRGD